MRLKPFDILEAESKSTLNVEVLNEVLEVSGIPTLPSPKDAEKSKIEQVRDIFTRHNAGPEDVARVVGTLMRGGENETVQLNAAKIAMQVQGWLNDLDKSDKKTPDVTINIIGNGNKSLVNLVMPQ